MKILNVLAVTALLCAASFNTAAKTIYHKYHMGTKSANITITYAAKLDLSDYSFSKPLPKGGFVDADARDAFYESYKISSDERRQIESLFNEADGMVKKYQLQNGAIPIYHEIYNKFEDGSIRTRMGESMGMRAFDRRPQIITQREKDYRERAKQGLRSAGMAYLRLAQSSASKLVENKREKDANNAVMYHSYGTSLIGSYGDRSDKVQAEKVRVIVAKAVTGWRSDGRIEERAKIQATYETITYDELKPTDAVYFPPADDRLKIEVNRQPKYNVFINYTLEGEYPDEWKQLVGSNRTFHGKQLGVKKKSGPTFKLFR